MVRRELEKIKNPQVGIYSVRYRSNKGLFTKSLSGATSFQYVTKSGSLSKSFVFPKNYKNIIQKRLYIYAILGSIISRIEKGKETRAIKKGKEYTKIRPEEVLNIKPDDLEILREELPEIFGTPEESYYQILSKDEIAKRIIQARKYDKENGTPLYEANLVVATTGKPTPDIVGEPGNWIKNQIKLGLIKEVQTTKERTRKSKKTGKVTKYKIKQKTYEGNGSLMFLFTRNLRAWFMFMRQSFLRNKDKSIYQYSFKFSLMTDLQIHNEYMLSDLTFMIPKRLSKKAYRRKIDGMMWAMAKEAFRLLNDDFPSDDEPKGGLTSDDIYTKIKYNPDLMQEFGLRFSLILVKSPSIPKSVIDSVKKMSLTKAARIRAQYFEGEEDE